MVELALSLGQGGNEADLVRAIGQRGGGAEVATWADEEGQTILHAACHHNPSPQSAELIINEGADTNRANNSYAAPLHYCASLGTAAHHQIAKLLLDHGASCLLDLGGGTPLDWARQQDNPEMTRLLEEDVARPSAGAAPPPQLEPAVQEVGRGHGDGAVRGRRGRGCEVQ